MSIWNDAADLATQAEHELRDDRDTLTPDKKIALAQVWATLSVAQELSRMIMDEGLSVRVEDKPPSERTGNVW